MIRQIKRVQLINSFHDFWDEEKRQIGEWRGQPTIKQKNCDIQIKRVQLINLFHDFWDEDKRQIGEWQGEPTLEHLSELSVTRASLTRVKWIAVQFVLTHLNLGLNF